MDEADIRALLSHARAGGGSAPASDLAARAITEGRRRVVGRARARTIAVLIPFALAAASIALWVARAESERAAVEAFAAEEMAWAR